MVLSGNRLYHTLRKRLAGINWPLFVFLLLILNVKLIVKVAAILFIAFSRYRRIDWRDIRKQRQVLFYFSMMVIALVNYSAQINRATTSSFIALSLAIFLWLMCAVASYYLFKIVEQENPGRLLATIDLFFYCHLIAVFLNLGRIMIECGTLNPYTYKGLHQKYFISTGDYISGIAFDGPVTTAVVSAFALFYFLYRKRFLLSLAATGALSLIASNLTSILLALILVFLFIFRTNRVQKSIIVVQLCMLIVFITKVSPQNLEYVGRFAYKMMAIPYDLPKKIVTAASLKASPDSILSISEKRQKIALLYIDSVNAGLSPISRVTRSPGDNPGPAPIKKTADVYHPSEITAARMSRYAKFIERNYSLSFRTALTEMYDWKKPGKWIAAKELIDFFRLHPGKLWLGNGAGKFSSRTAFKTTGLGMAGSFPARYIYIDPAFRDNHLFLYTYYHSQTQTKHAAENTPDSTYGQLLGEYGLIGLGLFLTLYAGIFLRRSARLSFALPCLALLLLVFFVEYWFEQLSIVILFELLAFTDLKLNATAERGKQPT
jgi:hypothetical protein